ncbi:hypothetical protein DSO57_1033345 [Entomophthora muscae]|uniref:Uncharacterized protein n=2 Tax=Entomophthora muscae TaxID=34485 RepID=A0ACC2RQZ7_9FUNG|nr:hypothetical protein DSO57_1033345 [Entomophthora muscae]
MASNPEDLHKASRPEKLAIRNMVAMICRQVGFTSADPISLSVLTNVAQLFLEHMAKIMKNSAEHGNRIRPDLIDLEAALSSVNMPWRRVEVSASNQIQLKQIKLKKINYLLPPDSPFLRRNCPIPDLNPVQVQRGLAPYPLRHTYKKTMVTIERTEDAQTLREKNAQQTRIVEENLKTLLLQHHQAKKPKKVHHSDTVDLFSDNPPATPEESDAVEGSSKGATQSSNGKDDSDAEEMPFVNYEMSKFFHIQKGSTIKSLGKFSG